MFFLKSSGKHCNFDVREPLSSLTAGRIFISSCRLEEHMKQANSKIQLACARVSIQQ